MLNCASLVVPAAGFYRAPLQNSYLKTVVAEKIIKFLYSFSQKAFHGEYQWFFRCEKVLRFLCSFSQKAFSKVQPSWSAEVVLVTAVSSPHQAPLQHSARSTALLRHAATTSRRPDNITWPSVLISKLRRGREQQHSSSVMRRLSGGHHQPDIFIYTLPTSVDMYISKCIYNK